jgi:hypothetical protein
LLEVDVDFKSLSSSINKLKSTDPFRFRKGRLPAGDVFAHNDGRGERLECDA